MKKMLINVASPEESRVAIVEQVGRGKRHDLLEIYLERASSTSLLGNIYKGRVIRVEPSIQAAFVDCGVQQNGFLHVRRCWSGSARSRSARRARR